MTDVVVVGAGISGAMTAWELASEGLSVTLVDRYGPGAMASGWTLAGVRQSGRDPAEVPLAQFSVEAWATLHEKLEAPTYYRRTGNVRLARTPQEYERIRTMVIEQKSSGLDIEFLPDNATLRQVEPAASPHILGASICWTDGDADAAASVGAVVAAAQRRGVVCRFGETVLELIVENGQASGIRTDAGTIAAGRVVVCAGILTPQLLAPLGIDLPLDIPMVTVLRSAPGPKVLSRVIGVANGDTAGRQEHDGRWRFTSGLQTWNGDMDTVPDRDGRPRVRPTATSLAETIASFCAVVPAAANAQIEQVWSGLIDMTPDALPVLDHAPGAEGLVVGAGFSGHGFGIGPATGRILADLTLGRNPALPVAAFGFDRLAGLTRGGAEVELHG